jgi:hypothetical protein
MYLSVSESLHTETSGIQELSAINTTGWWYTEKKTWSESQLG